MSEKSVKKKCFKLVLLGKSSVGKTCLIHRYIHNNFCSQMSMTFGVAYYSKAVQVDDKEIKLLIWDTAGQERFNAISRMYYRRANVAIVCVDVTDAESFAKMNYWINELQNNEKECKLFICCTKKDLFSEAKREVTSDQIEESASNCDAKVFVTSSKTGEGVEELFASIATYLASNPDDAIDILENRTIQLKTRKTKLKPKCCRKNESQIVKY